MTTPAPPGKVGLPIKAMHRIALLLAVAALAGCSARSPWAGGSAKAPVATPESEPAAVAPAAPEVVADGGAAPAATGGKYSWQAKKEAAAENPQAVPATGAPNDETKARILALRLDHGLIAFTRKEKPEEGAFLQLTKGDKALLIRVIRSDDTMTTADIIAGQDPAKIPTFEVGEEVVCGSPADLPPQ